MCFTFLIFCSEFRCHPARAPVVVVEATKKVTAEEAVAQKFSSTDVFQENSVCIEFSETAYTHDNAQFALQSQDHQRY